jgi:hypothetical protein
MVFYTESVVESEEKENLRHDRMTSEMLNLSKRWAAAALLILLPACVSRRIDLPPIVPPSREAALSELIEIAQEGQKARTLIVRAELQFETLEKAEEGVGRRYRSGQGRVLLARPNFIRLNIEAPLLSVNIADMASNGDRFQLLIYPEEYRAFIEGSNEKSYTDQARQLDRNPKLQQAGPLVNIRPQHITQALFPQPIDLEDPDIEPNMNEDIVLEDDDRPGARKNQQIKRSYYVLTVNVRGEPAPRGKYWFDRTRDLTLVRYQHFDSKGRLVGDVRYSGALLPPEPEVGLRLPSQIRIERPYDNYTLQMTLKPDSIMVNRDIPSTAFQLEPPPEWGDKIQHVDLDKK